MEAVPVLNPGHGAVRASSHVPILPLSSHPSPQSGAQQPQQHQATTSHQEQSQPPYEVMQGLQNESLEDDFQDANSVASTLDYDSPLLVLQSTGLDCFNLHTCSFASDLPATTNNKQAVIVHDMNVLSEMEVKAHWPLVEASLRKELGTFGEMKSFRVIPRSSGRNVMTSSGSSSGRS
eukprot:6463041-Amphidinium_carterae.3